MMGAVAVSVGGGGNNGISHSSNNTSYRGVNTVSSRPSALSLSSKGSSLAKTLASVGKYAVTAGSLVGRANPYIAGAMLLYEGYKYFSADTGGSSLSGVVSVDSTSTISSSVPSFDSISSSSALTSLSSKGSSVVTLPKLDLEDLPSSSREGKTLLEVLENGNKDVLHAIGLLLDSNNAIAEATSNVALSVNSLGVFLSQLASDSSSMASIKSSFYVDLIKILSESSLLQSPEAKNVSEDIKDFSDFSSKPSFNPHHTFESWSEPSDLGLNSESDIDDAPTTLMDAIASLGTSINPKGRADYFLKQNQISDYHLTPKDIKDMDGEVISTSTPLDIKTTAHASTARKHTDENNFELDEEDFDLWDNLPDMDFLFNYDYSSVDHLN